MRLLILGAAGRVGRLSLDGALERGHRVTALVRAPGKLDGYADRVRLIRGNVLDPGNVAAAMAGQDAVLYVIGAGHARQTTLFSQSTRLLLDSMGQARVRRIVCVTGVGAGETRGHGGFVYDRLIYPLFTRGIYTDKDRQESMITASDTDWTIVRPAPFRSRVPRRPLRVLTHVGSNDVLRRISTAEVARFLLDEIEQGRFLRQAVFIGHE